MVYDASAARAARREAAGEPFTFAWEGAEYALPNPKEWDAESVDLLAGGRVGEAFRRLLPAGQVDAFFAARPAIADIEGIMTACSQFFGLGDTAGE